MLPDHWGELRLGLVNISKVYTLLFFFSALALLLLLLIFFQYPRYLESRGLKAYTKNSWND